MAEVIWSPQALRRLALIRAYIDQFNPAASARIADRLVAAGDGLGIFPSRGRPAGAGLRELTTVPPYVIRYRVSGQNVTIITIKHGRQAG